MLEFEGYRVLEAENGLDGVEMVRRERPNAILMDMICSRAIYGTAPHHSNNIMP
jgi:CheY-like chemotaxis protein